MVQSVGMKLRNTTPTKWWIMEKMSKIHNQNYFQEGSPHGVCILVYIRLECLYIYIYNIFTYI
jgi:hypothetical protein